MAEMKKLSLREKLSYGGGGMGNAIVLAVVSTYLMFFYTDVIGLNPGIIGSILLGSKVFDGISDLVMGAIVDKTNSKWGKARGYMLWLCVPYAISAVLIFLLSPAWPNIVQYIYVFVTYNLFSTVMYTEICVPYNAMNCLMTNNQYDRGILGTTNVIGNALGQILVNSLILKLVAMFGNNQDAWIMATAVFGVIGIVMHMICFTQTKERTVGDSGENEPGFVQSIGSLVKNKYWIIVTAMATVLFFWNGIINSSVMYFASAILHDEQTVSWLTNSMVYAQIVAYFFAFAYIKPLGKGGCFKVGFAIAAVSYVGQILAGANYPMLIACGVVRGLGVGIAASCLGGIISDTIEYGEWKTGVRTVGMGNAANTFAQKIGSGIGLALVGWLLSFAGYSAEAAVQSQGATAMINVCYTYIPLVCCIVIVVLAMNYKLDKQYPQIIEELRQRKEKKMK